MLFSEELSCSCLTGALTTEPPCVSLEIQIVSKFFSSRFIVLRRIFLLVGIHYYYRAVTMAVTVLPKPNEEYICAPKLNVTTAAEIAQRVLKLLSGMGLSINGKHVYCGDYIYSGHTMTLIMGYFVIRECEFFQNPIL